MPRVRLVRKLALAVNGFDLSRVHVGDVIDVSESVASMLTAEGWAERIAEPLPCPTSRPQSPPRTDH